MWAQDPAQLTLQLPAVPAGQSDARAAEKLLGLAGADLSVFTVTPGGAAEKAGLRRGDCIIEAAGKPVRWWMSDLEQASRAAKDQPLPLVVERDGKRLSLTVTQTLRKGRDEMGVRAEIPEFGAWPDRAGALRRAELIEIQLRRPRGAPPRHRADGRLDEADGAGHRPHRHRAQSPASAIGGPLMIADVARRPRRSGWRVLIAIMAAISVTLGLMNFIPSRSSTGSTPHRRHRRRAPPPARALKFREMANLVGMVLLLTA